MHDLDFFTPLYPLCINSYKGFPKPLHSLYRLQSGRENPHLKAIICSFLTSHIRCILGHTRFDVNLLHLF